MGRTSDERRALSPHSRHLLEGTRPRLATLAEATARFWLHSGYDHEYGGFFGTLDRRGQKTAPTDKGLIQQARHLWAFSKWYERRQPDAEVRAVADGTYRLLSERFYDRADGEFFYKLDESGQKIVDPKKLLYAESFAIYGLSAYARAFDVARARELALGCFRSIDRRAHDAVHGGYDQSDEDGWLSSSAAKDTNTHLHLLESFTTLYELTQDATVGARLAELSEIVARRLLQPQDYLHAEFLRDFTPVGPPLVSYGHDLETAWLLIEAAKALGGNHPAQLRDASLRMGEHASKHGLDLARGGYYLSGLPHGPVTDFEKVWWVQFEALLGLLHLFELSGQHVELERFERTLGFIESQWDVEHGEWFWGVHSDGSLSRRGDNKGEEWKASYHNLRALVGCEDSIARLLG